MSLSDYTILFVKIADSLSGVFDFCLLSIYDILTQWFPEWSVVTQLIQLINNNPAVKQFTDVPLILVLFGSGFAVYFAVQLVKWLIDVIG